MPVEKVDLRTFQVLGNPSIPELLRVRLEKRREAIFVMRTADERLARYCQAQVRIYLAKCRVARRLQAAGHFRRFLRVWVPRRRSVRVLLYSPPSACLPTQKP
jgi:hypothetical protein